MGLDYLPTINKKVNSIHSFNRYLVDNGCTKDIVVDITKDRVKLSYGSERQVEVLTDKQVERILFYIQNDEKVSKRNRMIIFLLLYTGLRVSELCEIKIKNIVLNSSNKLSRYKYYKINYIIQI
jgi:integrase/recombinase XerD